jgi:hypothetical protein
MSRSKKRFPGSGNTTARSDKWSKVHSHRVMRMAERRARALEAETWPLPKEVSEPWDWPKDGKHVWPSGRFNRKYMAK